MFTNTILLAAICTNYVGTTYVGTTYVGTTYVGATYVGATYVGTTYSGRKTWSVLLVNVWFSKQFWL